MNRSKSILIAGAGIAAGFMLYKNLRRKQQTEDTPTQRLHKNRHLSPVFSKLKDISNS